MVRGGEPLTAKEKQIHDQGPVTVLREIHDGLNEAVLGPHGWSELPARHRGIPACSSAPGASPEEAGRNAYITSLLTRLAVLNHERAAELRDTSSLASSSTPLTPGQSAAVTDTPLNSKMLSGTGDRPGSVGRC